MHMKIKVAHLYPEEMNLYGDTGNILILQKRLQWRGIEVEVVTIGVGDKIPEDSDIIFGGGGQDASQGAIEKDFLSKKSQIKDLADKNKVMLFICGLYQLLGRKFITFTGEEIVGLGILPIETYGKKKRLIGNIIINVKDVGDVVGYENHSGQTFLDNDAKEFGVVLKGVGNNEQSNTEGCRLNNVFGTYLHGPILSKSPELADHLIELALKNKYPSVELSALDDSLEHRARELASKRPR